LEKNGNNKKQRKFSQAKSIGINRVGVDDNRFDPALLKSLFGN
jgi:hypothetical protein